MHQAAEYLLGGVLVAQGLQSPTPAIPALAGGLIYRSRLGRAGGGRRALTDDMIRQIEMDGALQLEDDEPLDLRAIREEEERFLEETWDEPDEP
jgi:hypothetical protein